MTRKFTIYACCILLQIGIGRAQQQIQVPGKVLDENRQPLEGVSVSVKSRPNAGTATAPDGGFNLPLGIGDTVIFSMVGYHPHTTVYHGQSPFVIEMDVNLTGLEEVVVVGFGTQKRANLTGSVSTVETGDLASRPFASTSNALQGVAPGVTVTTATGAPGSNGTIRVRGVGTLNDANPLVLIDGVEGDMNSVDPNMIESINVLKDAASSAIYGSRAANGVILVTTKRAKGDVLRVGYNAYAGFQTPTNLPDKVDAIDHMDMINLAHINSGASPLYTPEFIEEYRQNMVANPDQYPNTDWQKEVLRGSGVMHNHNLSINGGGEKIRFLTSAGYLDQQGIIKTSGFNRYTLRNNMDIKFNEKLSAQFDAQLIKRNTIAPGSAGEVSFDGLTSVFLQMNRIPAIQPGRYSNGLYGEGWNGNNPIAFANGDGGSFTEEHLSLLGRFVVNYKPIEWLNVELLVQPRYEELYSDNFSKAVQTYQLDGSPLFVRPERSTLSNASIRSLYGNYYGYLTANQDYDLHSLKLLLGSSLETYNTRNFRGYREGFIFPQYPVLDAGLQDNREATGTASEWALQSFFGRFNYDFDSRYLIEVNARYDGSSRFAEGHRYGFFPSVSAGWRISSEDFMQRSDKIIDNLMLRASWGRLGNQNIGTYPFASTLNLSSYALGGQIVPIAALIEMSNELISWETSEMTNIGLDLTLFGNLTVAVDWYNKITSDILLNLDIPTTIGLEAPVQNAGKVQNRGWDASVSYRGRSNEFTYDIGFNISDVKNTVLDLKGVSQTGLQVSRKGYPINSIFALQADGYFQSDEEISNHVSQVGVLAPGDIRYVNQNTDDVINADDFVIIGSTIPRFNFGINLNAAFKNFTFNAFAQGVGKADGYLYGRATQPFFSGASAYESHKDYWTPDNRNAAFPRLTWGDAGNNYQHSSFWMKSAAYVRLKNIQLGYNLPKSFLNRVKIDHAHIYINGQNLFTIDSFWDGYDVETPVGTGTNYPMVKIYSLGVDFRF